MDQGLKFLFECFQEETNFWAYYSLGVVQSGRSTVVVWAWYSGGLGVVQWWSGRNTVVVWALYSGQN